MKKTGKKVAFIKTKRRMVSFGFALCFIPLMLYAQKIDYEVHANVIYRIIKYIDWPEDKKKGEFVIGVLGDSPVYEELKRITASKKVGQQKIIIKKVTISDPINCQMLYISEDESVNLRKIVKRTGNMPVLIITEEEGLIHEGACISFALDNLRLRLELNKDNIIRRNMKVASELLQLAKDASD
jgi:hypothetical protein